MKTLVTGATGFVGNEIVRQLLAAGHAVRALVRNAGSPQARALAGSPGVELAVGSIAAPASLAGALSGCDAVIHLVGIISEVGANTFEAVHARGTAALVQAAQAAGAPRFIHMSALGTRPHAAARYHQTKWAAEQTVRQSGLPWTIFRPSLIYGPGDQSVNFFARLSRWSPVLPVMGAGTSLLQPVSVATVARCFVGALSEARAVGRTFDLCGAERLTLPQILAGILAVTGRRRWIVRVPLPIARLQAALAESLFRRLLRRASPLNRDQLIMLGEDNVGDPGPARGLFGLPSESFRAGLTAYLRG